MQQTRPGLYQEFLRLRWQRLFTLKPVTPWERKLLEHARFSIWLEARRNGITIREFPRETQKN